MKKYINYDCKCDAFKKRIGVTIDDEDLRRSRAEVCPYCKSPFPFETDETLTRKSAIRYIINGVSDLHTLALKNRPEYGDVCKEAMDILMAAWSEPTTN